MMSSSEDFGAALADLERASRHRLTEHWVGYFGAAPPPRTSRSLMIRAVAYKMQERVIGGLSAATRRLLCGEEPAPVRRRRGLRPGTVLIREWHGIAHQVTIAEKGVIYRGEHRRSLSEVARLITGARWSGPRFFGVKAMTAKPPARRCAVYTRKSSEEGLEQDFNSLHAQREACEAFIHRTWLQPDGLAKASFREPRLSLGPIGGGAVRLAPPGELLLVGEGIETTASGMAATRLPAWAALSATGLEHLILPPLPLASIVIILADNDVNGTGEKAAQKAAQRWLAEGRRVRIAIPPEPGSDVNDLLLMAREGCRAAA